MKSIQRVSVIFFIAFFSGSYSQNCVRRDFGKSSFVCVCNSTYCDNAPIVPHLEAGAATIITTSKLEARFQTSQHQFTEITNSLTSEEIIVDSSITYQQILGFGGAFTDAAGINIAKLSVLAQERLLKAYYSTEGIEYGIGRVPMAGTDFSTHTYSYDDFPEDLALSNFSLTNEDLFYKIPYISWAKDFSSKPIRLFASVWSAPAWMKTNNEFYGEGYLKEEYYQIWADYFVKFFQEYAKHNMTFWGVTAQNEPIDGTIPGFTFNCMGWTAETQALFVGLNLGPTLEANGLGHLKIMILDDQRFLLPKWAETVIAHPEASRYVSGIGVHWYFDYSAPAEDLTITHELFPDRFILATEACEGSQPFQTAVVLGSWERLETYVRDILQDINHWVTGWVDWNLALDEEGGPNWSRNFVDSPIIVNETSDEFYKQPMYYAMGHISKYVPEDSYRIDLQMGNDTKLSGSAFLRPDGMKTVVLLNRNDNDVQITLRDSDRGVLDFVSPARSLQTVVYG